MTCLEGTSVTACRLGEAHCHSSLPSPSLLVLTQERGGSGSTFRTRWAKVQRKASCGYILPGCRHGDQQARTETTANICKGNFCRIPPCGCSSEVGQDARQQTPSSEASHVAVLDGCLALHTSLELSLVAGSHVDLERRRLLCLQAVSWLRLGCFSHVLSLELSAGLQVTYCMETS